VYYLGRKANAFSSHRIERKGWECRCLERNGRGCQSCAILEKRKDTGQCLLRRESCCGNARMKSHEGMKIGNELGEERRVYGLNGLCW